MCIFHQRIKSVKVVSQLSEIVILIRRFFFLIIFRICIRCIACWMPSVFFLSFLIIYGRSNGVPWYDVMQWSVFVCTARTVKQRERHALCLFSVVSDFSLKPFVSIVTQFINKLHWNALAHDKCMLNNHRFPPFYFRRNHNWKHMYHIGFFFFSLLLWWQNPT